MTLPVWLNNLVAYSLQIGILAAAGTFLAYLFRLRVPRVALIYWQILLMVCLVLPLLQSWKHPIVRPMISTGATTTTISPAIPHIAFPASVEGTKPIPWEAILLILAAGISLRLMWLAIGFIRLRLFRRKSHMLFEDSSVIQDMQFRTGVRVTVLLSGAIHSPVTFGFRSPTIILPLSFKELSESCKQAVLCHELLHVRRYDWVLIIAEEIIRSIFWFHPAVWWLLSRVHLCREQAVDYEVVQLTGSKQPYLDSLLEFARTHRRLNAVPAPLFLREHHLVQRVDLLLKEVSMSRSRLIFSMIGISALFIGTVRLAAAWFPLTGNPEPAKEQKADSEIKALPSVPIGPAQAPVPARKQSSKSGVKAPQRAPVLVAESRPPVREPSSAPEIKAPQKPPIRVGGNVQESKLIHRVHPEYPEQAKQARINGNVRLQVTINEDGFVWDVQVMSGHPLLNEAAITAVKQWQYSQTLLNGEPVPVETTVTVMFSFMGLDDLPVTMDESGNLSIGLEQIMQVKGTVYLRIAPFTPYRVAESVIRDLMQKGVQKIELSGPYVLYQGRLFYNGPPPASFGAGNVHKLPDSLAAEISKRKSLRFFCRIYYSETGEALGLQRMGGDEFPELEKEILLIREEPVLINGEPVPFARNFDWVIGSPKID